MWTCRASRWSRLVCGIAFTALTVAPGVAGAVPGDDGYIEGYAVAILEHEFRLAAPSVRVRNGVVTVSAPDIAGTDRARVAAVLGRIRGVTRVEIVDGVAPLVTTAPAAPPGSPAGAAAPAAPPKVLKELATGFLPGGELLFKPLIADPRWPHFSASYQRYLDDRQLRDIAAVSFGETFAFYRDRLGAGWWELGLQAGVFAVFDLDAPSGDLVNADYFVALPLSYRYQDLSAIARLFHQSSHLGDEFLLRSRVPNRVNLSYEGVDAKISWEPSEVWRVYGGAGYLFHRDPSSLRPWSVQWGVEFRSPWPGPEARWRPIAAVDVQNREENDWHADVSVRTGVQLDGILVTRNLQILLEYFRGHSPNGQFYRNKIDYLGLGMHFHF
jgi:uncharacterized protein DUF1207